jgi:phospholipase C
LHTLDHDPIIGTPDVSNSQHPENNLVTNAAYDGYSGGADSDFARAESLIATVYEALRADPELFRRTVLLITYDEHGGIYDHVPPPTGVPAPGPTPGGTGRLFDVLLRRRSRSFDFSMLGPRVPAVVVSPYVPAGTVDPRVHDHACVPATLRAVFAPDAPPLTERDRWAASAPFHTTLSLDSPREADLPDLSSYVDTRPLAAGSAAHARQTAPAAAGGRDVSAAGPPGADGIPSYYRAFIKLADDVQQHLADVGEPEATPPSAERPSERAAEITERFAQAARRHRTERP